MREEETGREREGEDEQEREGKQVDGQVATHVESEGARAESCANITMWPFPFLRFSQRPFSFFLLRVAFDVRG